MTDKPATVNVANEFAKERNRAAAERTLMAWIRTALSLIGFGFGIGFYLEARWASLVPYAAAAGLLADVLPIISGTNATTLREHTLRVAERAETEFGEERSCFIDGCPADWAKLPIPEGRIVVGLDGGYVRDWEDRKTISRSSSASRCRKTETPATSV